MKKKIAKSAAAAMTLLMAASSLAGCSANPSAGATAQPGSSSASTSAASSTSSVSSGSSKGSCTIWTWDTSEKDVIKKFNEKFPNVQVNLVSVNYDDYMNKVQTAVAGGSDLGDILCGEYNFRAQLFKMDILEYLDQAPYSVDKSQIMDYELPLCTYNNHIVGLEGSITAGGIAYKAPLAKKYLGTDDVATLEKTYSSWDSLIDAGKKVQQASGGKAFLFHSWADVQEILDCEGTEPLTANNKPTDYLLNTMTAARYNILTQMLKYNVFDKAVSDHYTPAMNAAIADDNHIMLDAATWTPAYVIQPNDKNGAGKWREMNAPGGPFNCGGTVYGISKSSKNKDAAWSYLQWAYHSNEGGEANLAARNFFPPYKPLQQSHDFSKDSNAYFAPQNIADKFYKQMAPNIKVRAPEVYMNQIKAAFKTVETAVINDKSNSITLDKYKAMVKSEIKNNCPDLDM